jgi:hypothetical protein
MKKQALFMVVLLAAVGLLAGVVASSAAAYSGAGYGDTPCASSGCHTPGHAGPTVAQTANDGVNATYAVSNAGQQWAVFTSVPTLVGTVVGGAIHRTDQGSQTFSVPVGATYTVHAVFGPTSAPDSGGFTSISPVGVTNYTVTSSAGTHGTISPLGAQVRASGGNVTFTITPDAGYHVADVLVDAASVGAVTTYPFTNVTANHTISATFAPDALPTFAIDASAGPNGTITPNGTQTATQGDNVTFAIAPAAGYYVDTLTVDGALVAPVKSYTFTNVTKAHTIAATFALTPTVCTITSSVTGTGGSIMMGAPDVPALPLWSMAKGSSAYYMFLPAAGYHVAQVQVDGWPVTLDEDSGYTFAAVDRNHTVTATFAQTTWTLTATAGTGGTIAPGNQTVNEGTTNAYTITANAGFHIADVKVDGTSVQAAVNSGSYTFTNVTANHTIAATFAANVVSYTITPSVVGLNGTISPASAYTVSSGSSVTCDLRPAAGYKVGTVTIDGVAFDITKLNDDADGPSYTFWNVTANHTIAVTFVPVPVYTITPTAGANGSISPATAQSVTAGDGKTFTITANAGYHIADVKVDGTSVPAAVTSGSYTFTNVQGAHTISATFAANAPTSYVITATAGTGGTITPTGAVTVTANASQTFTVTPDAHYVVASVLVDGVAATLTNNTYTFTNVQATHTIAVTFAVSVQKCSLTLSLSGLKSGVLRLGKSVTAKGTLKPAWATTVKITVQRKVNGAWKTVTTKSRSANATSGAYSWTYKPTKKGSYRWQTSVAKSTYYTAATSTWKTCTVK